MKELLTYVAQNLVEHPDQVSVTEVEGDGEFNSLEEGESLDISAEDDFEEFDPA